MAQCDVSRNSLLYMLFIEQKVCFCNFVKLQARFREISAHNLFSYEYNAIEMFSNFKDPFAEMFMTFISINHLVLTL